MVEDCEDLLDVHLAHERRRGRERWLARVGARGGCHTVSPSWDDEQHRDQRNHQRGHRSHLAHPSILVGVRVPSNLVCVTHQQYPCRSERREADPPASLRIPKRSEEHTSELQSQSNLVCRLLLEKKKKITRPQANAKQ